MRQWKILMIQLVVLATAVSWTLNELPMNQDKGRVLIAYGLAQKGLAYARNLTRQALTKITAVLAAFFQTFLTGDRHANA